MTTTCEGTVPPFRGATVQFKTTFYDIDGEISQPFGAVINITYPDVDGEQQTVEVDMESVVGETYWIALWDTRDVGPGTVFFSIHTTGDEIPFAVEDGRFNVVANAANLPSF